jgi:hypothetical protein
LWGLSFPSHLRIAILGDRWLSISKIRCNSDSRP